MKRKLSSRSPLFLVSLYHLTLLSLPAAASLTLGACSSDVDMGGASDAGGSDGSVTLVADASPSPDADAPPTDGAVANDSGATLADDAGDAGEAEDAATPEDAGDAATFDGGQPPANPFTVTVASASTADGGTFANPHLAAAASTPGNVVAIAWTRSVTLGGTPNLTLETAQSPNGGSTWTAGPSIAASHPDYVALDSAFDFYVEATTGSRSPITSISVQKFGTTSFVKPANGPGPIGFSQTMIATGDGAAILAGYEKSLIRSVGGGDWAIVTPSTASGEPTICHTNAAGPMYFLGENAQGNNDFQIYSSAADGAISTWQTASEDFTAANSSSVYECVGIGNDVFMVSPGASANTIALNHWNSSSPSTVTPVTFANDDPAGSVSNVAVTALRTDAEGKLIVVYASTLTDGTVTTRARVSSDLGATFSSSISLFTTANGGDVQVVGNVRYVTYISTAGDVVLSSWTSP